MAKPTLLLLTPINPSLEGLGGSALRVGMLLEVLKDYFDISLAVAPYAPPRVFEASLPQDWYVTKQLLKKEDLDEESTFVRNLQTFDRVHIFKLHLATHLSSYLLSVRNSKKTHVLDLDDYDSRTMKLIADRCMENRDYSMGSEFAAQAKQLFFTEQLLIPCFDTIYVAQEQDRADLQTRFKNRKILLVPNTVRLPNQVQAKNRNSEFTFLFVGSMDYYPNQDAVIWFCHSILPLISLSQTCPFNVLIVGARPAPAVLDLARIPRVTVLGEVQHVGPYYDEADVVITPVRIGGGTRIKLLEAMSLGKCVISTSFCAQGLKVMSGSQLILADTPKTFAEQCVRAMADSDQCKSIGAQARAWVARNYSIEQLKLISL